MRTHQKPTFVINYRASAATTKETATTAIIDNTRQIETKLHKCFLINPQESTLASHLAKS
jgi:hypothetical protein